MCQKCWNFNYTSGKNQVHGNIVQQGGERYTRKIVQNEAA